jgi:hypothetical protein
MGFEQAGKSKLRIVIIPIIIYANCRQNHQKTLLDKWLEAASGKINCAQYKIQN